MGAMKIAINFIIVAFFCFAHVTCNSPSLALTPSSEAINTDPSALHAAMYQDILIHTSYEYSSFTGSRINVRRRSADGFYSLIQSPDVNIGNNNAPITNGKWVAMIGYRYNPSWIGRLNPITGDISNLTSLSFGIESATFIDDDTIAFYNYEDNSLTTIGYVDGKWIETGTRFPLDGFSWASSNPTATWPGNYFLATDFFSLRIYERLANSTWILADSIQNIGGSIGQDGVTLYNGNDTVFFSSLYANDTVGNQPGRLTIFKKTNNEWILEQQFPLNDLGINASVVNAGYALAMLDDKTILYGVPFIENNIQSGVVFVIQQNQNGNWSVIQTFTTEAQGQFGFKIFTNDYDIVISGFDINALNGTLFSIPKCYNSPINVTCNDLDLVVDLSECEKFNTSSLYTINNLQCGPVTSKMNQTAVAGSLKALVEYSFSRYLVNGSCTSRITCTQPPPASVPVTTSTTTPTTKVSGAFSLCNNIIFVSLLFVLFTL